MSGFVTGYIEGYYGRLLAWDQRRDLIQRVGEGGGSLYLMAPKEDPWHRQLWRKPYPASWRKACGELAGFSRRRGVELVPGMAPGLSFDYTSAADYKALLAKLSAFKRWGCRQVALLMDDIPAVLPANSRGRFATLGEAHGLLLQRLVADLGEGGDGEDLWFCPTVYCDAFSEGGPAADPYLRDLAAMAPSGIRMLWTGTGIVPRQVKPADIAPLQRLFPGRVVLWDNLYAQDYCPWKIFLGPFSGRPQALKRNLAGLLLNPTGLVETDKFYLDQLAAWKRGASPLAAWKKGLSRMGVPDEFRKLAGYLNLPQDLPKEGLTGQAGRMRARALLKPLIWNWKSAVQREWYPFLFMLDADLRLGLAGKDGPDEAWIRKRYTPLVAQALTAIFPAGAKG